MIKASTMVEVYYKLWNIKATWIFCKYALLISLSKSELTIINYVFNGSNFIKVTTQIIHQIRFSFYISHLGKFMIHFNPPHLPLTMPK